MSAMLACGAILRLRTKRFEIVALARGHHAAVANGDALSTARHLKLQHAFQADEDLEVVVIVAAVRGAVVAHAQAVVRDGHVTSLQG